MSEHAIRIEGECSPEFAKVRAAFEDNFVRRGEIGAAVCVYKDGKKVVDLWGGHKDPERQQPWKADTIVIMNSLSKSMSALCVHMLIDRGSGRLRCSGRNLLARICSGREGKGAGSPRAVAQRRRYLSATRPSRAPGSIGALISKRSRRKSQHGSPARTEPITPSISGICSARSSAV